MNYLEIIKELRKKTEDVILFHSGTGKDSIFLCDLLSKEFNKVVCVFMYIVKGLEYENNYIQWAENKYKNIIFYQTPHYCLSSYIKNGYLGIKQDKTILNNKISYIDKRVKEKFNIEWSVYGFKKNDGITRRIMLNSYKDGVCESTKKVYPLQDLTNGYILSHIEQEGLIKPFCYDNKKPSSGCEISQPLYLAYIKNNYPEDLKKIFAQFPYTEINLYKHENKDE